SDEKAVAVRAPDEPCQLLERIGRARDRSRASPEGEHRLTLLGAARSDREPLGAFLALGRDAHPRRHRASRAIVAPSGSGEICAPSRRGFAAAGGPPYHTSNRWGPWPPRASSPWTRSTVKKAGS